MAERVQTGGGPAGTGSGPAGGGGGPAGTAQLLYASELAKALEVETAPNGLRFATFGELKIAEPELRRVIGAVPASIARSLGDRTFYFVPLALPEDRAGTRAEGTRGEPGRPESARTLIAPVYSAELAEEAICHRNVQLPASTQMPAHEAVFLSARLLHDTFAVAFELFINVGHAFAGVAGIPEPFSTMAWSQVMADVRGETSQDAWESRGDARPNARPDARPAESAGDPDPDKPRIDEKARLEYYESAYADALAIYQLSLAVDFDYSELREREYPLLAPAALADRLRLMARLFPPNPGYDFSIRYRRRA